MTDSYRSTAPAAAIVLFLMAITGVLVSACSSTGSDGLLSESTLPLRVVVGEYIGDDVSRAYRVRDTARMVSMAVEATDQATVSQLRMEAEALIDWSNIPPTRRELIVELLDLIERRLQGVDVPPTVRLQELARVVESQAQRIIEYLEQ